MYVHTCVTDFGIQSNYIYHVTSTIVILSRGSLQIIKGVKKVAFESNNCICENLQNVEKYITFI